MNLVRTPCWKGAAAEPNASLSCWRGTRGKAVTATLDNAGRNGVGDRLAVHLPQDEPAATYPVVVANILASALVELRDVIAARCAPGARIAMSGILAGQEDEVIAAYADVLEAIEVAQVDDWMRVSGRRRAQG